MSKQIETFAAVNNIFTPASTPQTPEQILESFEDTTPENTRTTFSDEDLAALHEAYAQKFTASCREIVDGAIYLDNLGLQFDEVLPEMLLQAGMLRVAAKPTAKKLMQLILTQGGMKLDDALAWIERHARTVARAFASIRDELIEAGVTGIKQPPTKPAIAPRQPNAAQSEPAPDMQTKPAAQPKSSPLASDVAMCLSTASEAALGAAWETMPESTKAKIMKAFQL